MFLRDAAPYGIKVIVSLNHYNEIHSKAKMEIDYRIALQAKDRFEYTDILDKRTMLTAPNIPGRGLCVLNDRVLEYHTAIPFAELEEKDRPEALRNMLKQIASSYQNIPNAVHLPAVDRGKTFKSFCESLPYGRIRVLQDAGVNDIYYLTMYYVLFIYHLL